MTTEATAETEAARETDISQAAKTEEPTAIKIAEPAAGVNTRSRRKGPGRERASDGPAIRYRLAGLAVTPVRGKQPWDWEKSQPLAGWQKLRSIHDEAKNLPDDVVMPGLLPPYPFPAGANVGVLNGEPSDALLDTDLDAPEAVKLAPMFLPATACIFGRASKRRSHYEYRAAGALPDTAKYKDVDGTMLVELRSTGTQTVWPGSIHDKTGERIRFEGPRALRSFFSLPEPARIEAESLLGAVKRLAACALVSRHWPRTHGSRQDLALAYGGLLGRCGLDAEQAAAVIENAARHAGDDEAEARGRAARETVEKLRAGAVEITGGNSVAELLGDGGEKVVKLLRAWFNQRRRAPWTLAKDVQPERVEWLWVGRLARGKLAMLDGDPGQGKSAVTIDLAARVSTGAPMPGETERREPGGAVIISYEDGCADTIRPRLEAAGADLRRVAIFDLNEAPTIPNDLTSVEDAIRAVGARLLIVDPLMASISDGTDSHNDHQMRRVLKPLVALGERLRVAVLGLRHRPKGGSRNAVMSGGGSVATIGAARTGMMAAFDPDAPGDLHAHVLAVSKCNLTSMGPTLKYKTVGVSVNDPKGQPIETVKIEWAGTSTHSGDAIVAHESLSPGEREKRTRVEDVMEELVEVLTDGPRPAEQVYLTLGRSKTDGTLRRAKDQLGVLTEKGKGKGAAWFWRLPGPNLAPEA